MHLVHTRSWLTWTIISILLLVYLLVFFLATNVAWPLLVISLVLTFYTYGIWLCAIKRIVYNSEYHVPFSPWIPIFDFISIFLLTILHNMMLYAAIALMDTDAYLGIEEVPGTERWRVLLLSLYLAVDTTVIAGSGAVNPNTDSDTLIGFIPIILNYVQGMLLYVIIGWGTV